MSNDKIAATFHPNQEVQMTEQNPQQDQAEVKTTEAKTTETKAPSTRRLPADEQEKILRAQGATDEQIKEWQDHNSVQPSPADDKPRTAKK